MWWTTGTGLECLDKLETSNQYLISLINDILDMSRIESGKMELNVQPMDMEDFVRSLEGMMLSLIHI